MPAALLPNWKPLPALRSELWLAYVRSLKSVQGKKRICVAHHPVGNGRLSTLKVSDFFTIPLTDAEHRYLHDHGWLHWESKEGPQPKKTRKTQYDHARDTLQQGIRDGVLVWQSGATVRSDMDAHELEDAIRRGELMLDKRACKYIGGE